MDGTWTYLLPQLKGGGVMFCRAGAMHGGDTCYFYVGTYDIEGTSVRMVLDITLFNPDGLLTDLWGTTETHIAVEVEGELDGDHFSGLAFRPGFPATPCSMTRRGVLG